MLLYAAGKPVLGDVGELVCTKPFPSMPTHFWNDKGGIKYKKAYFSHWPGEDGHNCLFISLLPQHSTAAVFTC